MIQSFLTLGDFWREGGIFALFSGIGILFKMLNTRAPLPGPHKHMAGNRPSNSGDSYSTNILVRYLFF